MKKIFVLLFAAAVAMSAAAGVQIKAKNVSPNANKTKSLRSENVMTRNSSKVLDATQLNVMDWSAREAANHMLKADGNIVWDFEDEAQLADWMVLDNDGDGYNWEYIYDSSMTTHSGYGIMSSASYDNPSYTALYPDNWLISPKVVLNGKVGVYACGQDPSYAYEVFAIYVCVGDPTNINDFVKISNDFTTSGTMKLYTADLSEYEGQEGCIAIRHYNVTDMFRLNVDDITIGDIEEGTDPEPQPEVNVIYDIPAGLPVMTFYRNTGYIASGWGISAGHTDGKINVAFDEANGEVYVQNPLWWVDTYNAWVKGTYTETENGCMITIPVGQYLYWSDAYQYGIQLMWGRTYVYEDYDEYGELGYYLGSEVDERAEEIEMMIADGQLYLLNCEGDIDAEFPDWANATGMMGIYSDDLSFLTLEFVNNEAPMGYVVNLVPAVPANPSVTEWYDCGDESGFSRLYFTLPTTDVDGNMIDPEYLSYSIFVDNGNGPELFTFPAADYTYDLYEDITVVDYALYSSAVDFTSGYCYFYRTNADGYEPLFTQDIGIQVYYTVDGVKNHSDFVWLYGGVHSGVNELANGKTVANVRYYNVAGQEMAQPSGMTIQVTTYTDGTRSAVKVVK